MNLIQPYGGRTIYSIDEIAKHMMVSRGVVEGWIRRNKLRKGGYGPHCILQKDFNEFSISYNAGKCFKRREQKVRTA